VTATAAGVVAHKTRIVVSDHPVCGAKVGLRRNFLNAAASPPHEEGNGRHCGTFLLIQMKNYLARCIISIGILLAGTSTFMSQTPSVEGQVKAGFLYNFAQFIQWPSHAFADREMPFTMCVTGDAFEGILEKTVERETLNGRRIAVRRLGAPDNLHGCHLLYVGKLEAKRTTEFLGAASRTFATEGLPILTVGDSEDFINVGGMIRFTEAGNRVRFEINPEAAERVSLRLSANLLRVADIVRPR
jgi:YfiR/HmsC-like